MSCKFGLASGLALTALLVQGCGDKKASEPPPKVKTETPTQQQPAVKDRDAKAPAPALQVLEPLATQLEVMQDIKFLGWLADGRRFVVKATYGDTERNFDAPEDLIVVRQVYDALTGMVVESYRVKNKFGKGLSRTSLHRKAWNSG